MTTNTEARELVERLRSVGLQDPKGPLHLISRDVPARVADTITALLAENERLRERLHRIAQPGRTIAYCQDGHEEAVLIARNALKGADDEARGDVWNRAMEAAARIVEAERAERRAGNQTDGLWTAAQKIRALHKGADDD